jgi:hypothetical protein
MENGADQPFFDAGRVPKEIWSIILGYLRAERKYPNINQVEFILPFLKLVGKRFYSAVKDYMIENKIHERSHNRRIALMLVLAEWGALSCIKLLRDYGVKWGEGTCEVAARGGHLDVLKYARENGCLWEVSSPYKGMCISAIIGGNVECLKYVQERKCQMPLDNRPCERAAEHGHLEMLKYLRSLGCALSGETVTLAIKNGHLDCVKYLHEEEKMVKLNSETMDIALDLEVMKYLKSVEVPWSEYTCSKAAGAGRLDCLKYAHENGAPWKDSCHEAAKAGQLDCLKYAHENGAHWNTYSVIDLAASKCHYECMKYIIESGEKMPQDILRTIICGMYYPGCVAFKNKLACMKYAHKNGATFTRDITEAAARAGALDCLAYAHEHGCPWDERLYFAALRRHSLDCIKYAHEHGCPWSSDLFYKVIVEGNLEELRYITQEGCPMDLDQQTVRIIKDYMVDNRNARNRIQEQLDYLKTIGIDIDLNARDYSKQ